MARNIGKSSAPIIGKFTNGRLQRPTLGRPVTAYVNFQKNNAPSTRIEPATSRARAQDLLIFNSFSLYSFFLCFLFFSLSFFPFSFSVFFFFFFQVFSLIDFHVFIFLNAWTTNRWCCLSFDEILFSKSMDFF